MLNADCFLRPGFLAAALPRLAEDGVGSVAPKLSRPHGPGDRSGRSTPQPCSSTAAARMGSSATVKTRAARYARPRRRSAPTAPPRSTGARRWPRAASASTEVLDEDMALWASDADLAWRAQLLGWRCAYEPAAVAEHVRTYSPSTRAQISEDHRRLQFRNRYLMMIKNETRGRLGQRPGPDRRSTSCSPSVT